MGVPSVAALQPLDCKVMKICKMLKMLTSVYTSILVGMSEHAARV